MSRLQTAGVWPGFWTGLCVAAFLLPNLSVRADDANPSSLLQRGKTLYEKQCAICHGEAGDGQGKFAYLMNPRPRNFLAGKFKLTTTENQIPSDSDLLRALRRGIPGSAMPPWGHLPLTDLNGLVAYIRQLNHDAVAGQIREAAASGVYGADEVDEEIALRTVPGPALRVPPEAAFDDLAWFRGRQIYLQACASCHGVDGQPVADAVKFDDEGYPDPPRSFVKGIFKGGMEGHQLYSRIMKGMRGTPMPAYEGSYSDDAVWDLIHYVQSLARAGAQERAELRSSSIVATRVATLPDSPTDEQWEQARGSYVGLAPLWWNEKRIEGLVVHAIHDGKELALRFSWLDPTMDDRAVKTEEFHDSVAVQFSLSSDPPFYMGGPGEREGVNMWLWKADRQTDLDEGYQDVDAVYPDRAIDMYPEQDYTTVGKEIGEEWPKGAIETHRSRYITAWGAGNLVADPTRSSPVESLVASGPGTLAGLPPAIQLVQGAAEYEGGVWMVQMKRALSGIGGEALGEGRRSFSPGDYIPVSFAIWNGDARDRDGKKNISIWQRLVIE